MYPRKALRDTLFFTLVMVFYWISVEGLSACEVGWQSAPSLQCEAREQ